MTALSLGGAASGDERYKNTHTPPDCLAVALSVRLVSDDQKSQIRIPFCGHNRPCLTHLRQ
jgi:hypothetical protein